MLHHLDIMIKDLKFTRMDLAVSNVLRHKALQDVDLESAVHYATEFIDIFSSPEFYEHKNAVVQVHKYRATLPCDFIGIYQVMDNRTNKCLRSTTGNFLPEYKKYSIPQVLGSSEETFRIQNSILITSICEGELTISYKALPIDEEGFPMIYDNPLYLKTLELYIKVEVFTDKADLQEIPEQVLKRAQQDYYTSAKSLEQMLNTPSESEMESIMRQWTTPIQGVTYFDDGFDALGNRQYIRRH